jgi:chemotaxis protein MotB
MKDFLKRPQEGDSQEWTVMWGDMLSVLLTFFILLFGVSQMDQGKYSEIMTSIGEAFQGSNVEELGVLDNENDLIDIEIISQKIKETIAEMNLSDELDISIDGRGAVLYAPGEAFFASGESKISKRGKTFLSKISTFLRKVPYKISVEGHTDDVPVNSAKFSSNWELSSSRASSVVSYFIEEENINPMRLSASGYSKYKPLFPQVPANRAKNRRVEIIVLRAQ